MIANIETIPQQDAVVMLRLRLGPIRVWSAFLADCNRERQHVNGYTLLPCASKMDKRSKMCPQYEYAAVLKFIEDVLASTSEAGPMKIKPTTLAVDDTLTWKGNAFDRAGKPVRRKSAIYASAVSGAGAMYRH